MIAKKITVILADDEPVARSGIRAILSRADDIELIGEAENGFSVQELVAGLNPHVLLLDLRMPGPRPADLERWVREYHPGTATLVLTGHSRDALLAQMMEAGVAGYLTKDIPENMLIDKIREAARGGVHFEPEQVERAERWRNEVGAKWECLSSREQEVAIWLARMAQNRFIASELGIAEKTVEVHVTNILKKLELPSRTVLPMWMTTHFPEKMQE